jgi:lipid A ethanolaminephosphotransferase
MTSLAATWPVERLWRPMISSETLIVIVAAFLVCADNVPLWRAILEGRSWSNAPTWGYACGVFFLLTATYYVLLAVCAVQALLKPVLIASLIAGAVVAYYIGRYNVVFDAAMMSNVLHTDAHEAIELIDAGLLTTVLIAGIIPSLFVMLTSVRLRSWQHALAVRAGTMVIAMIVAVCALLSVFQTVAPLVRSRHEIRHLLTPLNLFSSAARSLRTGLAAATTSADPPVMVSRDVMTNTGRPTLFVLVVGETARSANFSLNGYARETNPELSKLDIINFPRTRACGTSTEVSLPCMFSPFGRRSYDEARIARHESLVQQISHAGIRVVWRDNQSGCKGVCAGIEVQRFDDLELPGVCTSGRCFDEVLLRDLDTLAREKPGDVMLVLHQIGNHGPAYYRRYPPQFKHFEPACETDVLHNCTQQQIVNAYDNALRYTDHVLAQLIGFLQAQRNQYDVALMYASDHGESLGEKGLYLHGMPYAIAPKEQLEVPMIWWLSPEFTHNRNIDVDCLRTRARHEASHDHLFHSITGVLGVETPDRDQALDLFAQCRSDAMRRAVAVSR